jgi:hypothetical protein
LKFHTASHIRGEEMLQGSKKGGNGMGSNLSFWSWDMIAKACPVAGTLHLAYGEAHIMHFNISYSIFAVVPS